MVCEMVREIMISLLEVGVWEKSYQESETESAD